MDNEQVALLEHTLASQPQITQWRFALFSSREVQVGVNASSLCGPYAPPMIRDGISANLYIIWKDGKVTKTSLEPHHFKDLHAQVSEWKRAAFMDPEHGPILEPQPISKVRVYDAKVARLIEDPTLLFEHLSIYQKVLEGMSIDAEACASVGHTYIRSSTGLRVDYPSTQMSTYCFAQGQYGQGEELRKVISTRRIRAIAKHVKSVCTLIKRPTTLHARITDVIFSTEVMASLLEHYLQSNLSGDAVAHGESAFRKEDFVSKRKLFSPRISFVCDSLSDFEPETIPCSAEGIPGGRHTLISRGRLYSPELTAKYANMLKLTPTGRGEKYMQVQGAIPFEDLVKKTKQGVIIYGVLGMHTQNNVTGEYSLPCYLVAKVKNGRVIGSGKASISGNFFANLKSRSTQYAYDKKDPKRIAMKVRMPITPME